MKSCVKRTGVVGLTQLFYGVATLLFTASLLSAQPDRVFQTWDLSKPASFPGGYVAFHDYFKNTPYPSDTVGQPRGNRLIAGFVLEPDGAFSDLRIF